MSDQQRSPTHREIAKVAGVSPSAVSFALRDDPRISAPVRARIQAVAKQMGYRPNPLLAAYQTALRTRQPSKIRAVLGWINDHPAEDAWLSPWLKPMLDGAKARAEALGYVLDQIWLPGLPISDPEGNARQWQRIMRARGIHGTLLPSPSRAHHAVLSWDQFSMVVIGTHQLMMEVTQNPMAEVHEHHRVNRNYFQNMHTAILEARKLGYRRVGLAIGTFSDFDSDCNYSAAYLRAASNWPESERVPILYSDNNNDVAEWAQQHHPDVVICVHPGVRRGVEQLGLHVPRDIGIVHLTIAPDVADWTGIDPRLDLIGSAAVDLLTSHLQRNERGVPPYAKEMIIEGRWVAGKTTRQVGS